LLVFLSATLAATVLQRFGDIQGRFGRLFPRTKLCGNSAFIPQAPGLIAYPARFSPTAF
jgi:hypothetical protein